MTRFLFLVHITEHYLTCSPIAFNPTSVLFETPDTAQLLQKVGVRQLVIDVIDELIEVAAAQGCSFPADFRKATIERMTTDVSPSTMYQDFQARRPMEVETYLGAPLKMAIESDIRVPRTETLYAMLHHVNTVNQNKEPPTPMLSQPPLMRMTSRPGQRMPPPVNGFMRPPSKGPMGPPPMRRAPSGLGMRPPPGPGGIRSPRDPLVEGMDEFNHLALYDDDALHQNGNANGYSDMPPDIAMRERELAVRQRELQLREQEMMMRRRRGPQRPKSYEDDEDEDDYFDPMDAPPMPNIDPDSVDMMSITSRRNRRLPSAIQMRRNPEVSMNNMSMGGSRPGSALSRLTLGNRRRTSDRIMDEIPAVGDPLLDNPLMSVSSDRFGAVDRRQLNGTGSRSNSLTPSRLGDIPPMAPFAHSRRNSQSPGTAFVPAPGAPFGPPGRGMPGRPMAPGDLVYGPPNGVPRGQPSPPRPSAAARYPSGPNGMGPQQVESQYGVSNHVFPFLSLSFSLSAS